MTGIDKGLYGLPLRQYPDCKLTTAPVKQQNLLLFQRGLAEATEPQRLPGMAISVSEGPSVSFRPNLKQIGSHSKNNVISIG